MECHYSVLAPGKMPHPPHIHDEEEIQMLVQGEAELIAESEKGSGELERFPAKPGDLFYLPANWLHTYENTSDKPVVSIVFKWITDEDQSGDPLRCTVVKGSESLAKESNPTHPMEFETLLQGRTGYLRKLQIHRTTLQPGEGYEPHIDGHDVGIIHFEGQVETLGETVTEPSFIYYAAGHKHGMRNTGSTVARHIAFEFHGKHGDLYETPSERRRRKLLHSITKPGILFRHIKWVIGQKLKKPEDVWPEQEDKQDDRS